MSDNPVRAAILSAHQRAADELREPAPSARAEVDAACVRAEALPPCPLRTALEELTQTLDEGPEGPLGEQHAAWHASVAEAREELARFERDPLARLSTATLYAEVRELESYVLNPHGPESQVRDQRMLDARLRELVRRGEEC